MANILAGRTHQYMRSEYIQPPPSPPLLDAKKSPLALLAQTCSAIGQDNNKSEKHSRNTHVEHFDAPSQNDKKIKTTKRTISSPADVDQGLRRKSTGSTNIYSANLQKAENEQVERKISAPSISKFVSPLRPERKSPDVVESANRSSRRLSATPLGISGELSSPDGSERASSPTFCRRVSELPSCENLCRYSPANMEDNSSPKVDISKCDASHHGNTRKSSNDISVSHNISDSKPCSAHWHRSPNHTARCDCGPINSKLKGQNIKLSTKFSFAGQERACLTCEVPHVPGDCHLTSSKYNERYFPLYDLDRSVPCPGVGLPTALSVPFDILQSQLLWSAMMNRNAHATPEEPNYHLCKWVSASEGNCGKVFKTREELLDHLSCHAMPTTVCNELQLPCSNSNYLSPYANNPALGVSLNFPGINSPTRLGNVPLAGEHLAQPGQRRCNLFHRYHPYKANYSNCTAPFIPLFTSHSPASLYGSYSLYDQAVRDLNSLVFP